MQKKSERMNASGMAAMRGDCGSRFALFDAGFRPFFLLVALSGVVAVPVWLCIYAGAIGLPETWPAQLWHGHEMVFGGSQRRASPGSC
jgi:uncharacterized protein involved in response to NO